MYVEQHQHEILQYFCMFTSTWTLFFAIISNSDHSKCFTKILSVQIFFYDHSPNFCKKFFLLRPLFATLEKYARFSRARNFARARRAPKIFWKKFEFIKGPNICNDRMAGKTLVRPENGRSQRISKYLADMTRKNHIKIFFKVM